MLKRGKNLTSLLKVLFKKRLFKIMTKSWRKTLAISMY